MEIEPNLPPAPTTPPTPPALPVPPPLTPSPSTASAAGAAGEEMAARVEALEIRTARDQLTLTDLLTRLAEAGERERRLADRLDKLDRALTEAAGDTRHALRAVAQKVSDLDVQPDVDPFGHVFVGNITSFNSTNNAYAWQEQTAVSSNTLANYPDGRICSNATLSGAATEINGWKYIPNGSKVLMVEIEDRTAHRYYLVVTIPAPPDPDVSYVLGYDGSTKKLTWYEQDDCS